MIGPGSDKVILKTNSSDPPIRKSGIRLPLALIPRIPHLQGVIAMNGSNGGHRKTAITSTFDLCHGGPQQIFTTSGGQEVLMILSVRSAQAGKNCPIAKTRSRGG